MSYLGKIKPNTQAEPVYTTVVADHYQVGRSYHIRRPRGTHDYLFTLTLKGSGIVASGQTTVTTGPDVLTVYHPDNPQDYRTNPQSGTWEFLWVHCHAPTNLVPLLSYPNADQGLSVIHLVDMPQPERRRVTALFNDAVLASLRDTPLDRQMALNLIENLLLRIYRTFFAERSTFAETIHGYIAEHLREPLTVARLAEFVHLSPSHFAYRFRKEMNATPQAYVESLRLTFAQRLLSTNGGNIKDAALTAGFPNPLYFSKRFHKAFGYPPSRFRPH